MANQASHRNTGARKTTRGRRKASTYTPVTADEALEFAVGYLMDDFGTAVVAIKEAHTTSPAVGNLMCDYVRSLVNGDGSLPAGLTKSAIIIEMREAFVEVCEKRLVGTPLPGQNTDWYDDTVAQHRSALRSTDQLAERRRLKQAVA
ncbi:MAG: hypothetical protein ABIQ64_01105 [Candidatus Saccharimonadales bacterium]